MITIIKSLLYIVLLLIGITKIYADDYSNWKASQDKEYTKFKKSYDDEFTNMLKKQWQEYKTYNAPSAFKKQKPKEIPKIKVTKVPQKEIKKSTIVKISKKIIKQKIIEPKKAVKQARKSGYSDIAFSFYNQLIDIQYDDKFRFNFTKVNKNTISQSWQKLSKTNYINIIKQIDKYSDIYSLNDWAKYLLIHKIGTKIYTNNNQVNVFTWFILTKMKYDTKVAYDDDLIHLLANVQENLFQVSFLTLDKKKYSILTPNGKHSSLGSLYTYKSDYKNANKKMSFDMQNKEIALYSDIKERVLSFTYDNKKYSIKAKYSLDLVKFYKTFPQSQYSLYYDSQKSKIITNSLFLQLKPLLANKTELEAVNFLLRFVQTAFNYKTDSEQFSYEKVFFPEETLYYSYSDCEDRSILFVYLVKEFLGLDAVGLLYSDHMSSAVHFSTSVSGDAFKYNGKTYIISDPTYINANAGITMPKYKNSKFTIVK
jgi:hypothetical protein